MSVHFVEYQSAAMNRTNEFIILLPNDVGEFFRKENPHYQRPPKVLMLLHGHTLSATAWLYGSNINELSSIYNLAVIMPSNYNGFYVDRGVAGEQYESVVGEVLDYCVNTYGLSTERADTFIEGLSMGGYGATHIGLKHSDRYGKIVALSSAYIVDGLGERAEKSQDSPLDAAYYRATFGDLSTAKERDINPKVLLRKLQQDGKPIPDLFLGCGVEDPLLPMTKDMEKFLTDSHIPYTSHRGEGSHDWKYWGAALEPSLKWLLGEEDAK